MNCSSPSGRWIVYGPSLPPVSALRSRMFANVPRAMTSWWPRRPAEELGIDGGVDHLADLVHRGPQVGEHDRPAVAIATERLGREVDVDSTGERERDDERRRRKVRGAGEGMDPPLEVPVAREDRRDDE